MTLSWSRIRYTSQPHSLIFLVCQPNKSKPHDAGHAYDAGTNAFGDARPHPDGVMILFIWSLEWRFGKPTE